MKHGKLVLILVLMIGAALTTSWAGSQTSEKKGDDEPAGLAVSEFGTPQRPPAVFDHDQHEAIIRCQVCHHEFFVFENEEGGQGQECAECHKVGGSAEVPVTLLDAFHRNCKGCHQRTLARGKKSGPVMCGQCHVRQPSKKPLKK